MNFNEADELARRRFPLELLLLQLLEGKALKEKEEESFLKFGFLNSEEEQLFSLGEGKRGRRENSSGLQLEANLKWYIKSLHFTYQEKILLFSFPTVTFFAMQIAVSAHIYAITGIESKWKLNF